MKTAQFIILCLISGFLLAGLNDIKKAIENHPTVTIEGSTVRVLEPVNNNISITESEVSL